MKILKYLLFLLLIFIIGAAIYIAVQPNEYYFNRTKIINAPQAVLFNTVNDYEAWQDFSPWMEQEPDAKVTYDEKITGEGAGFSWDGEVLGKGSMTTIETDPNESIDQKISFVEPFTSEANIRWDFEPVDNGTKVTWAMNGKQDFMTKMFTAFMGPIEKTTGPDFERGLFKLDSITQAEMKKYSVTSNGVVDHSGAYYLYTSASTKIDNISSKIQELLPKVGGFASKNNVSLAGSPFLMYHEWDPANNAVRFSACVPTTSKVVTTDPDILTGEMQPFKAFKTTLKGDFSHLQEAWTKAREGVASNPDFVEAPDGPQIEVYVTDPQEYPNPAQWITEIYIALIEK